MFSEFLMGLMQWEFFPFVQDLPWAGCKGDPLSWHVSILVKSYFLGYSGHNFIKLSYVCADFKQSWAAVKPWTTYEKKELSKWAPWLWRRGEKDMLVQAQ